MIDLHTHSTFSDGTMSPERLVKYAEKLGIEALALTDHDTVSGIESFLSVDSDLERVSGGVELSVSYEPGGTFHLLGLFVDHRNEYLNDALGKLKDARRVRNDKIIKLVSELVGKQLTQEDISSENEGELGRPHIAKYLCKTGGIVQDMDEAFDKYLAKGKPYYVARETLDFHDSLNLIHEAGGVAILAHPFSLDVDEKSYSPFIKYLKGLGLDGIEVYTSDTDMHRQNLLSDIALEHDMAVSGGSDFHGDNQLSIGLGTGRGGEMNIPYSVFAELKRRFNK